MSPRGLMLMAKYAQRLADVAPDALHDDLTAAVGV